MRRVLFFALVSGLFAVCALGQEPVRIADDDAEWPPYTYYVREGGKPTSELAGFSVDLIRAILDKHGLTYRIELLPWKRAQSNLEEGSVDILLNCSYSEERSRRYYLAQSHYQTTPYYFYSPKAHPAGLKVSKLADLGSYRAGGILGYNYSIYGLDEKRIDLGSKDFELLFAKLDGGRFDFFIEQYEIVAGLGSIGSDFIGRYGIRAAQVPGMKPTDFHMAFTRSSRGLELKELVDRELDALRKSGRLEAILGRYLPNRR